MFPLSLSSFFSISHNSNNQLYLYHQSTQFVTTVQILFLIILITQSESLSVEHEHLTQAMRLTADGFSSPLDNCVLLGWLWSLEITCQQSKDTSLLLTEFPWSFQSQLSLPASCFPACFHLLTCSLYIQYTLDLSFFN